MICNSLKKCAESQFGWKNQVICNNGKNRCIESFDARSNVKCEEKNKKYILENTMKEQVILYRMDGGIISMDSSVPEGTCKCDFLFLRGGSEKDAVLVELKGKDVTHSLKQIHGTLLLFKDFFQNLTHVYGRVVVAASTPNLKATPEYTNLVRVLKGTFKGNLKIAERQFREKDIDLNSV